MRSQHSVKRLRSFLTSLEFDTFKFYSEDFSQTRKGWPQAANSYI